MSEFTKMVDLLAERLGGQALACSDDFFASMDNLVKPGRGVFFEDKYTERGKWMDGWESRRRRDDGYDWCVLRLGLRGIPKGFCVDTNHFRGNHPAACSVEVLESEETDVERLIKSSEWQEVVPRTHLDGHSENLIAAASEQLCTHVRLNIYPDGGVARLRVFGVVQPDWSAIARAGGDCDVVAVENGGRVLGCSDEFFGQPQNLLLPGDSLNMGDGWETRRRRGPGHDWSVIQCAAAARFDQLEIDTKHFKGNFPDSCTVDACRISPEQTPDSPDWREILSAQKLKADTKHVFRDELSDNGPFTHVRLNIYPDGGVARLRIRGQFVREGTS